MVPGGGAAVERECAGPVRTQTRPRRWAAGVGDAHEPAEDRRGARGAPESHLVPWRPAAQPPRLPGPRADGEARDAGLRPRDLRLVRRSRGDAGARRRGAPDGGGRRRPGSGRRCPRRPRPGREPW